MFHTRGTRKTERLRKYKHSRVGETKARSSITQYNAVVSYLLEMAIKLQRRDGRKITLFKSAYICKQP